MAGEDNALSLRQLFLLSLKGRVTVYFVDGSTLAGEMTAQDELHIFLEKDEGETVMIPRGQIKYIQAQAGQPIVPDSSYELFQAAPEAEIVQPAAEEEEEEEKAEEEVEGTVVLQPHEIPAGEQASKPAVPFANSNDATFVLQEPSREVALPAAPPSEQMAAAPLDETVIIQPDEAEQAKPRLVCTNGPHTGEVFDLSAGIITIGRSVDNTIAVNRDKEVSRRHAIIIQEGDKHFIQDQNSLNGTFVNDELVKGSHYLKDGDLILIGLSTFEFQET